MAKLESGDSTDIETITKKLDIILAEDPLFAEELRILGQEIQAGKILTDGHIFQYKDKYCYVKASNS